MKDAPKYTKLARAKVGGEVFFYGLDGNLNCWYPVKPDFQENSNPDKAAELMGFDEFNTGAEDHIALTDAQIDGWWAIAKVGKWSGSIGGVSKEIEITTEHLFQIAGSYSADTMEAPLNIDHTKHGAANGWVDELRVNGDLLEAKFKQLDSWFRMELREGRYRSRSAEIVFDFQGTGQAYLYGVAFLGVGKPAVKGLPPIPAEFSGSANRLNEDALYFRTDDLPGRIQSGVALFSSKTLNVEENLPMDANEKKGFLSEITSKLSGSFSSKGDLDKANKTIDGLRSEITAGKEAVTALTEKVTALEDQGKIAIFNSAVNTCLSEKKIMPAEALAFKATGMAVNEDARAGIIKDISAREPNPLFFAEAGAGDPANKGSVDSTGDPLEEAVAKLQEADKELSYGDAMNKAVVVDPTLIP